MSRKRNNKDKKWLWHPALSGDRSIGHPMDVEDVDSAFFCTICKIVDRDETHWEEGEHLHDADW